MLLRGATACPIFPIETDAQVGAEAQGHIKIVSHLATDAESHRDIEVIEIIRERLVGSLRVRLTLLGEEDARTDAKVKALVLVDLEGCVHSDADARVKRASSTGIGGEVLEEAPLISDMDSNVHIQVILFLLLCVRRQRQCQGG